MIVLGSGSQFRYEIFSRLQIPFQQYSPNIDETALKGETALKLVERLGYAKALATQKAHPNAVCIGADEVAEHNHLIYGKPLTAEIAFKQLSVFSDQLVNFVTNITILAPNGFKFSKTHVVTVTFRRLKKEMIQRYIQKDQPFNSCGSFKADGLGLSLVKTIKSDDPTAIIGLPLIDICEILGELGITIP